jgi:uncharacterized surface protein with fasciclin (FAS1) repeats
MLKKNVYGILRLLPGILFLMNSCEKKFDEYYKVPENLIGTVLDVLKKDGNYTQFIKAVEVVEFDDVLGKTGNFTVFAPDDKAFQQYLSDNGFDSIQQVPAQRLNELVMYHIMFWSYSRFKLQYGLGVEDNAVEYDTRNFKKQTRCRPPLTEEYDTMGRQFTVYHENKFIPVYFDEYFADQKLEGAGNYNFFYPGSAYSGSNVDRANVVEWDVPAQNGWIHKIDKVLIPPLNHNEILLAKSEFSTFKSLLDKRIRFTYNDARTRELLVNGNANNGIQDSVFLKSNSLFQSGFSPNIEDIDGKGQSQMMTVFAPTNEALQNFLTERTRGYSSLNQIGEYFMDWYLLHYFGGNYWPSQLSEMTTKWESPLTVSLVEGNISEQDIVYSQMASNGPFYGIQKYLLPKVFETVVQPIFGDKNYEWFCELLIFYQIDLLLNNENIDFTVFAPNNQAMSSAGYTARNGLGGFGLYSKQNPLAPVPRKRATDIIKSHIIFGKVNTAGLQPGTFLKTIENSYLGISASGIFGGGDNVVSTMGVADESGLNGILVPINRMLVSPYSNILQILDDQTNHPEFEEFLKLLISAELITFDDKYNPLALINLATGVNYSCFVPSNDAIKNGILDGTIPTDPKALAQFLRYHFVEGTIFSDGKVSGSMKTTRYANAAQDQFNNIEVINALNDLQIRDELGNTRKVTKANIMSTNGVVHLIDSLLIFQ